MKRFAAVLTAIALGTSSLTAVQAADTSYSEWKGGKQSSASSQSADELVKKLNGMIDEAQRAKAADPKFLRDLRRALKDYERGQQQAVEMEAGPFVYDDFSDRNINQNPAWTIAAGKFSLDPDGGIRSIVQTSSTTQSGGSQNVATAILDTLLGGQQSGTSAVNKQTAELYTPAQIDNAFTLTTSFVSRVAPGRLDWVVYQGSSRSVGYRLSFNAEQTGYDIELSRFSAKGSSIIQHEEGQTKLEDGRAHQLSLTRNARGEMTVALDGSTLFSVVDRAFSDPFAGIAIANQNGDFTVRSIEVGPI
ncbi:MAG: hypothetical protein AB7P52_08370 [Alphaproteobacteria bacterium]